jgi:hypothetical protein
MPYEQNPILVDVFAVLRKKLSVYSPPMQIRMEDQRRYELWSVKDLVIEGRKRKDVYFAGLMIQKDYVGFYFMPVYVKSEIGTLFSPELAKLLKGKSCFHIKRLNDSLQAAIESALSMGFQLYQERGWV